MSMVRLIDLFGPHCTDAGAVDRLLPPAPALPPEGTLLVSFDGVRTLAPSFASALLLWMDAARSRCPAMTVELADASPSQAALLARVQEAMRGETASS